MDNDSPKAFTLIELLLVITIIVLLLAMLTPALDKALLEAVKAQCGARQKGLVTFCNMYAADNRRMFPIGQRQDGNPDTVSAYEDVHWVHAKYFAGKAVEYGAASTSRGAIPQSANDPFPNPNTITPDGLFDPNLENGGFYAGIGLTIGYEYLGGHPGLTRSNRNWRSPISLSQKGSGQLIACENRWVTGRMAWIAHFKDGGGHYSVADGDRADADTAVNMGSAGGFVGRVDGGVAWVDIEDMKVYDGSSESAPDDPPVWPAMW
jgi:prepilin-type N-terminal cleavage/methylation domain-containing protein